ncbi:meckelin [Toxorhynchites rutilus septentrionalis]|uniref:meckelin n=1 Tax=Toxorhynchites rutilus septentrionalis TaxID=329112 RepID=UPI002478C210|nr:meckelin [Toxorhynchites rutilus septentrionalis]XP_055643218.1 meckelin [Toxorhynchites rutilus septentrionalis]
MCCTRIILLKVVLVLMFGSRVSVKANANFYNVNEVFLYTTPTSCRSSEYFDTFTLKCNICDEGLLLKVADDHLRCTCDERSVPWRDYDSSLQSPICRNTSDFFEQIEPRVEVKNFCKQRHIIILNSTKTNGVIVQIYRKTHPPGNESTICGCNQQNTIPYVDRMGKVEAKHYCFPQALLKDIQNFQPSKMTPRQNSNVYRDIRFLMVLCHVIRSTRHCQRMANLCVLSFYHLDRNSPCGIFHAYQTYDMSSGLSNVPSMVSASILGSKGGYRKEAQLWSMSDKVKPPLFYRRGKHNNEVLEKYLDFSYDANATNLLNNTINFTIISYDLYGHLKSFRAMRLSDLNLCERYAASQEQRIKFAQSYHRRCRIGLRRLLDDFSEVEFLNLYADYYDQKARLLQSIPVLVRKAFAHNESPDPGKWQLVRRFLMVDPLSGLNENFKPKIYEESMLGEKYHFVRYVRRIELEIRLHPDHEKSPNRVAVPLLKIEYAIVNTSRRDEQSLFENVVDFEYEIIFSKKYSFNSLLEIILPIFILLAFTMTLFQTFCYKLRQNKMYYDMDIFFNFLVYLCSNVATALLAAVVIVSLHVFITYKTQRNMKMLLPVEVQNALEIFVYIAFSFKFIKLVRAFNLMAGIDIFFIDWERPKIVDTGIGGQRTHLLDTHSISSNTTTRPSCDSVSAWRNYFIANEWQELATKRKISWFAHIILLIGAFVIFGFEHWSSKSFSLNFREKQEHLGEVDKVLEIAVGIIVYTSIYFVQRVYNLLIHERFVENGIQQFIDVSSIANISVFILCMESYGFYIHGRSPHGFSDTDMCSMILQFKREEDNLCGNRGLLPGSEQQTYSILVPKNLREYYNKLITPLRNSTIFGPHQHFNQTHLIGSAKMSNSSVIDGPGGRFEYNFEKSILTYYNVNRFFAAFVDHALKDLDYIIQERSVLESLLNCELQSYVTENKGVFYIDNGHSFDQVLFYGIESIFFQFEIALFLLVLLVSNNYIIATVAVGVVYKTFEIIMNYLMKNNLAKKTLIDKRFLI